jgi:hypothetical protein
MTFKRLKSLESSYKKRDLTHYGTVDKTTPRNLSRGKAAPRSRTSLAMAKPTLEV